MVSIRTPRAGRDASNAQAHQRPHCFYPHAPGGARPVVDVESRDAVIVSIRTPRAGRDCPRPPPCISLDSFYPHAPGGARLTCNAPTMLIIQFLSARPGRGATCVGYEDQQAGLVSIRTPRAGRDEGFNTAHDDEYVSIRTPRAGRDVRSKRMRRPFIWFLSARPGRGATVQR